MSFKMSWTLSCKELRVLCWVNSRFSYSYNKWTTTHGLKLYQQLIRALNSKVNKIYQMKIMLFKAFRVVLNQSRVISLNWWVSRMILFQKCPIYLKVKLMTVSIRHITHHKNVKEQKEAENKRISQRIDNSQKYVFVSSRL